MGRKANVLRIIQEIVASASQCENEVNLYRDFCVSTVDTFDVAEYKES